MPYLCTARGPVEVELVQERSPDCLVRVFDSLLWVPCNRLKSSADGCEKPSRAELNRNDPIAVRFVDSSETDRVLPATILKAHANGRFTIRLDGFSRAQTIDLEAIIPLKPQS